jgi:hypothetical protein
VGEVGPETTRVEVLAGLLESLKCGLEQCNPDCDVCYGG